MSYDLYFRPRDSRDFSADNFKSYFLSRPHYKVENNQAIYGNNSTGAYFIFDYNTNVDQKSKDVTQASQVIMNLNFLRPHFFVNEAEPEISSIVKTFDFLVFDPQLDGNKSDVYTKEDFIRGWVRGNILGIQGMLKSQPHNKVYSLPSADIEGYWRWNYGRDQLQKEEGDNIFVPHISFHSVDGRVRSLIVWTDAIPTIFPAVDDVLIYRHTLAPSKFLSKKKPDYTIMAYEKVLSILGDLTKKTTVLPFVTFIPNKEQQERVRKYVLSLPGSSYRPTVVKSDMILDQESLSSIATTR